jgi:hypothetical protein
MRRFLLAWQQRWEQRLQARVYVYADDLVILCRGTAAEALTVTRDLMRRIKLELNEEKTRVVDVRREGFDFLGHTFGPMYNPKNGARYLGAAPSKARVRRLRQAVHRYFAYFAHRERCFRSIMNTAIGDRERGASRRWAGLATVTSLSVEGPPCQETRVTDRVTIANRSRRHGGAPARRAAFTSATSVGSSRSLISAGKLSPKHLGPGYHLPNMPREKESCAGGPSLIWVHGGGGLRRRDE